MNIEDNFKGACIIVGYICFILSKPIVTWIVNYYFSESKKNKNSAVEERINAIKKQLEEERDFTTRSKLERELIKIENHIKSINSTKKSTELPWYMNPSYTLMFIYWAGRLFFAFEVKNKYIVVKNTLGFDYFFENVNSHNIKIGMIFVLLGIDILIHRFTSIYDWTKKMILPEKQK